MGDRVERAVGWLRVWCVSAPCARADIGRGSVPADDASLAVVELRGCPRWRRWRRRPWSVPVACAPDTGVSPIWMHHDARRLVAVQHVLVQVSYDLVDVNVYGVHEVALCHHVGEGTHVDRVAVPVAMGLLQVDQVIGARR
jgi:hypothetical protein